jgi:uncharacterized protein HemX
MESDKSATILEAQWMEREIPKMEEELAQLRLAERDLLTTPLETVRQAYTDAYRVARRQARAFYRHRRSVTPTRYGYRERRAEAGWFTILSRVLILVLVGLAVYVAYHNHQMGETQKGVLWASVLLVVALGLALAPAVGDQIWERRARQIAQKAAAQARTSEAFLNEKHERQVKLAQCQSRAAEVEERLRFARARLDVLRKELTSTNHRGEA